MTAKIDGTNGLLQQYDYQTPTTGFSYTFAAGTQTLIANPAGTLATGTITMPAAPADGMVITVQSTQQITALTIQGNTGQSLVGGAITMRANQPESFVYRLTNTTWYPFAGAANTQIISGTSVASTSGTSVNFTSIPSWVKRVTVMFSGVSTNGTSPILVQLGDSGGIETTGYSSSVMRVGASASVYLTSTAGLLTQESTVATSLYNGLSTIVLLGSNIWLQNSFVSSPSATNSGNTAAGSKTLSDTLDSIRITTVNGTDTFDAGTINILYE